MSITKEFNKYYKDLHERMKLLKEELSYWKKYKHLEFDKLEKDEDYWDCVVMEHNLKNWDCDKDEYVYPEGKDEYNNFCKYFPRPQYED